MKSFTFLAVLLLSIGAAAQSQSPGVSRKTGSLMDGTWSGAIMGIKLIFHFATGPSGKTEGTMDSPQQGATGLPIKSVVVTRDSIYCLLTSPTTASYTAARL